MILVDDHLAFLAIADRLPELEAEGPTATTWGFWFRAARSVSDSARHGSLSRRVADPERITGRVLHPPADRLLVLDPRASGTAAVWAAVEHGANLLLAELLGAAIHHHAAIRVTPANVGRRWAQAMAAEHIDFGTVEP